MRMKRVTKEQDKRLVELRMMPEYSGYGGISKIAKVMGMNVSTVRWRLNRLAETEEGYAPPPSVTGFTQEEDDLIMKLRAAKLGGRLITKCVNAVLGTDRNVGSIRGRIKLLEGKRNGKHYSRAERSAKEGVRSDAAV